MTAARVRNVVPVLGVLALAALFLSLPEAPNLCGLLGGKACPSSDPYLALLGAGYFATLVAVAILFPDHPGPLAARGGLASAVLLAPALSYVKWPGVCPLCLFGHACNILMWAVWWLVPARGNERPATTARERLCLALFAPVAVVALFGTLNLTFGVYGFNAPIISPTGLRTGVAVPTFTTDTAGGRS